MEKYYNYTNKFSFEERTLKKSGKVYYVRFNVKKADGSTVKKSLGPFKTKSDGKDAYYEFVYKHCLPLSEKAFVDPETTSSVINKRLVKDYYALWLSSLSRSVKTATLYQYRVFGELYILKLLGDKRFQDLSKGLLQEFQDTLWNMKSEKTGKQLSAKYIKDIKGALSLYLDWCSENYGIRNNLKLVKTPKAIKPKPVMKFWTEEEFEQFISVVDDITMRVFFTMLFYTGRRKGEVMALQKTNIRFNKNDNVYEIIFDSTYSRKTVNGEPWIICPTKNNKVGISPVAEQLEKCMNEYQPKDGPFYFGGEKPLSEGNIDYFFNKYIRLSGVKKIRIHDLRHSFVSMLLHNGANILTIAELIGDNPEQITQTYGHVYNQDRIYAIKNLNHKGD